MAGLTTMTRWLWTLVAATALTTRTTRAGFFGGPTVDGDSYKWDGKGDVYDPAEAFSGDDKYNIITLSNWDMSGVSNLSIPHSVQTLTLLSCKLSEAPEEIGDLSDLETLNMAGNKLKIIDTGFGTGTKLTSLNVTANSIANFNAIIPTLQSLDLSANALVTVPSAIFQMTQLTSLYLHGNQFKIASVSIAEFDFYAGLGDFKADFVQVSSCDDDSDLVNLKGSRVCRTKSEASAAPVVIVVPATSPPSGSTSTDASTVAPIPVIPTRVTDKTNSTGTKTFLAYGAIFSLLAFGCIGGVYMLISRRRTARLRGQLHEETPLFFDSDKRTTYAQELAAGDKLFPSNDPVLVTWRLDYDTVKLVRRIAKGAYGEVWVGRYRNTKVAVKKLLEEHGSYEASEDFIREIKLMAWLKHPKIVEFIGVAWTRLIDMLAVTEFMDGGDLRSYLDTHRNAKWPVKLQFALDTIDAIVYLHSLSPVIIHRDLKSRNILVDSRKGAKLGDFGISAAKRDRDMTVGVGTTRWLAPELARGDGQYTEAVDIYSFGVILSELDTHELPFNNATSANGDKLSDFAILQGVISGELSVRFTEKCPENIRLLAQRCVSVDPAKRPSAPEIAYELRRKDILLGGSSGGLV